MDKLTPERRSDNMRKIKSKGTQPEMIVRRLAHSMGYLLALAIIAGSARKQRDFLLKLSDNVRALLLTLTDNVLAIIGPCSQTERRAHAFCH